MIPLPALQGTMQKHLCLWCFREHPTRRVLVRAVFPPQSGWTLTQVLCYTGQRYSRRTWSWKFWEISRQWRYEHNQSTLYTPCMCRHLKKKKKESEETCQKNMKSQRVMGMGGPFWQFVRIQKNYFFKYEWADTSLVDGHAGIIIVAVSNFRACARVVLTFVTFNCRALRDRENFFARIILQNRTKTHLMLCENMINGNTYQTPAEPERTPHTLQQKLS